MKNKILKTLKTVQIIPVINLMSYRDIIDYNEDYPIRDKNSHRIYFKQEDE